MWGVCVCVCCIHICLVQAKHQIYVGTLALQGPLAPFSQQPNKVDAFVIPTSYMKKRKSSQKD